MTHARDTNIPPGGGACFGSKAHGFSEKRFLGLFERMCNRFFRLDTVCGKAVKMMDEILSFERLETPTQKQVASGIEPDF